MNVARASLFLPLFLPFVLAAMLPLICRVARAGDGSVPEPLSSIGVFGGGGYGSPGWRGTEGLALSSTHLAFESNEPGALQAAALAYAFPNGPNGELSGSLYFYLGMGFLPGQILGIGPMLGFSEESLSVLKKPGISGGGRVSLELPCVGGFSLVPSLAVVSDALQIPLPAALFTLELRFSFPAALISPTR